MLRKKEAPSQEQNLVGLTERDAHAAFMVFQSRGESFERPDQSGKKFVRLALNEAGVIPPFTHATPIRSGMLEGDTLIELALAPPNSTDHPISVTLERDDPSLDGARKFNITFTPGHQAIVTKLKPGESLEPIRSPELQLSQTQKLLNEAIRSVTRH